MFDIKLEGYEQALGMFDSKIVDKSAYRALNRAVSSGRTEASKSIRGKWNIQKKDLDSKLTKITAKKTGDQTAVLIAKSRPFSLTYFGAKWYRKRSMTTRQKSTLYKRSTGKSGVYAKVLRGGQTTHMPHSFIQSMRSGHMGVFERLGKKRYPIKERKVITIASMFDQANAMQPTVDKIEQSWSKEFFRQLELNEYG